MFKYASKQALLSTISNYCMLFENEGVWSSAVVIAESYAASALHCVPQIFRVTGTKLVLHDGDGELHEVHVHGICTDSDYVVFRREEGVFKNVPEVASPQLIDKYVVVGCTFGERTLSVRVGHVSCISTGFSGFFYGDSGGLPGYSGGGAFCSRNGHLLGVARGSNYHGNDTKAYGDVLELISAPLILRDIHIRKHEPYST